MYISGMLIPESSPKLERATWLETPLKTSLAGRTIAISVFISEVAVRIKVIGDADTISGRLDTAGQPDPDLIIRPSGELRISNFLLWQSAYAELYFTDMQIV